MKDREEHIEFHMNYCQHYGRKEGSADMECKAGMNLKEVQKVPTGDKGYKWGPCIEGHVLENPHEHCPHWIRRTREEAEKRADAIERAIKRMELTQPTISAWRTKPKPAHDRREVIVCPVCKGKLHLSQSCYNGHVHAHCETKDCISFME